MRRIWLKTKPTKECTVETRFRKNAPDQHGRHWNRWDHKNQQWCLSMPTHDEAAMQKERSYFQGYYWSPQREA